MHDRVALPARDAHKHAMSVVESRDDGEQAIVGHVRRDADRAGVQGAGVQGLHAHVDDAIHAFTR